jgi:hypothetical protein
LGVAATLNSFGDISDGIPTFIGLKCFKSVEQIKQKNMSNSNQIYKQGK